jgi:protein-S-isoprenylcysteine O-methyltransferase Ste14
MKKRMLLVYGTGVYALLVATVIYGIAFFGNLVVARTIDAAPTIEVGRAFLLNFVLLLIFALQHGGMARPGFRRWLAGIVGPAAERSTYVLLSAVTLIALMFLWQPIGWIVWSVENALARYTILAVYFSGWVLMIWATFLLDHFELFGLRQTWGDYRDRAPRREPAFRTPSAYRFVRHPIYTGWLAVLWAAPVMTMSHLVFSVGITVYVILGARLEERDLEQRMPCYRQYRRKVPMLLPSWRKRLAPEAERR